ncbi:hypothetical protein [Methanobrevibacter sp.]|uniref:hypothetical protein n=1 Tax=Methanobrevibacter sp. TaxID=66852 RepID=UPI003890954C
MNTNIIGTNENILIFIKKKIMDYQVDYLNSSIFCCFVGIKAVISNSSRYYKFASVE